MRSCRPRSRETAVQTHFRRSCRTGEVKFACAQVNATVLEGNGSILVGGAAENQCIQFHPRIGGEFQIQYGERMMERKIHSLIGFGGILHGSPKEIIFDKMLSRAACALCLGGSDSHFHFMRVCSPVRIVWIAGIEGLRDIVSCPTDSL